MLSALLWKDANVSHSLELIVYFHHEGYNFSLYPAFRKRASGIFLPPLIVPLSDGSFLVALGLMHGIASICNN